MSVNREFESHNTKHFITILCSHWMVIFLLLGK